MEAFAMGGYGPYIWSCFGLALVVVLFADWRARLWQKRVYRDIEVRIKALEDGQ